MKNKKVITLLLAFGVLVTLMLSPMKAEAYISGNSQVPKENLYLNPIKQGDQGISGVVSSSKGYSAIFYRLKSYGGWHLSTETPGSSIINNRFYFRPMVPVYPGMYIEVFARAYFNGVYYDTQIAVGKPDTGVKPPLPTNKGQVIPNTFNISRDTNVTGTIKGDVTYVALVVNGARVGTKQKVANNAFVLNSWQQITKVTDDVYVQGYNSKGLEEHQAPVKLEMDQVVETKGSVFPDDYTIGQASTLVTGTYTGDVKKVQLTRGNVTIGQMVAVDANGTFDLDSFGFIQNMTYDFYVNGYDQDGKLLDRKKVNLKQTQRNKLYTNPYSLTLNTSVSGWYEGEFKEIYVYVNGSQVGKAIINSGLKTYELNGLKDYIKTPKDVVLVRGYTEVNQGGGMDEEEVAILLRSQAVSGN